MASTCEFDNNKDNVISQEDVELWTRGQILDIDYFDVFGEDCDEPDILENSDHLPVTLSKPFQEIGQDMEQIHPHVKKKIIKPGVYGLIPPDAIVTFHYESYFDNKKEPFDSTLARKKPYRISADNEDLFEGMPIALQSMKVEETAYFLMDWQVAYGERGSMNVIPPKADLFAVIHVLRIETEEKIPCADDLDVTIKEAEKYLVIGKRQFVESGHGTNQLHKAIDLLDKCKIDSFDQQQEVDQMKLRILSNLCGMYNRSNRPELAIVHADEALRLDPRSEKALLALAEGHTRLKNFAKAHEYLSRGLKFHPNCSVFNQGLEKLKSKKDEAN